MRIVEIIYTGRSGKFTKDRVYKTTWYSKGRGGSKSPDTWVFSLKGFRQYRVMPYEFKKYWKFKDSITALVLVMSSVYSSKNTNDLIYKKNPFLEMIPKEGPFRGHYYPIPIIYGE